MKVKKWLLGLVTFAAMVVLCVVCAGAETYGDLEYHVLDDGTVEITDYNGSAETVVIPDTIDGKSVTSIGESAFSYCDSLTSITIPNGVTSIGESAFNGCTSLTAIDVEAGNSNYTSVNGVLFNKDKTELICYPAGKTDKSYNIPNSVTSIGDSAFEDCTSLTSITIPNSVTSIGDCAFLGCEKLSNINLPKSLVSLGRQAFSYCRALTAINIPKTLKICGSYVFMDAGLKAVTIEDGITAIPNNLFDSAYTLETLDIPDTVTSIGESAFSGCSSLTSITIPDSVTSIGDNAFSYCSSLTSINIPHGVTSIGDGALGSCLSLTAIDVNTGNENYTSVNGVLFNKNKTELMQYPAGKTDKSYTIPNGVTSIGGYAFSNCSNFTSVTIPDSVTSIGDNAFYDCSSLISVTIPNGVTSIGSGAFQSCSSLTSITIPEGATRIEEYAFAWCSSLETISIPDGVTFIGYRAIEGCENLISVNIPDSVTSISENAFFGCPLLINVEIPASVIEIGKTAFGFSYDENLDDVANDNFTIYCDEDSAAARYARYNNISYKVPCTGEHTYSDEWTVDRESSFDNFGVKSHHCTKCGFATDVTVIPQKSEITYDTDDENNLYVSGYKGNPTDVVIPSEVDGKRVTGIGDKSFYLCKSLTSIIIPDDVTYIGENAFDRCRKLTSITIPENVTKISKSAFDYCTKLTAINVTAGNKNYASVDGVLFNKDKTELLCYPAGKPDKSYTIPGGVKIIGNRAFENFFDITYEEVKSNRPVIFDGIDYCSNLENIVIPDGVTSIGNRAFSGCSKLENITIPNSVTSIGDWGFDDCSSLTSVTLPNGVTKINVSTFSGCSSLTSIEIPDSVTSIGDLAFNGCSSLTSITIPNSVTDIGKCSFGYYYNITTEKYLKFDGFKIYCYSGTAGEQYAKDNYFDYVLLDKLPTLAKITGVKLGGRAADALRVNWTKNASADGYIVEMYQGNKWVRVAKITSNNTTTFRKAGLKAGTVYKFRVRAYKMSGKTAVYGAYSTELAARTNPSVMTGAKLGGRAADALMINWSKNASADGYIVEMYQGGKWSRVAKITKNSTTTFRKAGLKAGTAYKFRVKAYKMSGKTAVYGAYSATVAARTNPSVIKGAKLGGRAADALRINWTKNASADGYIVEMYQNGKWTRVAKITSNSTTTFKKAGLKASSVYKFRVRAYKMSGKTALYGNYSATVTVRTNPSIVKGVKIGGKAKDALRVNWAKNTSAQGYIVEMYKGNKWVRVAKITSNSTTTFRKAGLKASNVYKFRVRAYKMSGKTALYGNYGSVSGKTAAK